jgi:hypothetical protein
MTIVTLKRIRVYEFMKNCGIERGHKQMVRKKYFRRKPQEVLKSVMDNW